MADKISEGKYGLSGSNGIRTHNHLVRKRILNQLAKLECWWGFFNWDSLHARLKSHYETWSYKKKKHKNITAYRKSV